MKRDKEQSDAFKKKASLAGAALVGAGYLENERRKHIPKYYEDRIAAIRKRGKGEIDEMVSHGYERYTEGRKKKKKKNRGPKLSRQEWIARQQANEELFPSGKRNWQNKKGPAARHTREGMKKIEARYGKKLGVGFVTVKRKTSRGKEHSRRKAVPGVWKDGKFTPKTSLVSQVLQNIPGLGGRRRTLPPAIFGLKRAPVYKSGYRASLKKGKRKGHRKQPGGALYGREDKLGRFKK